MRVQLKSWVLPTGVGVASFCAGVGAGYLLHKYVLRKKIERINREPVSAQLKLDFERVEMDIGNEDIPSVIFPEIDESVSNHPSNGPQNIDLIPIRIDEDNEQIVIHIFPDEDDDWDYDEEVKNRGPDHPYIIHRDEYFSNEMDYRQTTITFYEGDQILCDEQDAPIYNPEKIVGVLRFGHGSQDVSICYVRNERLEAEYEVLIDHGYYQEEVLGAEVGKDIDIRHSIRIPKFKRE
jgi:hypothetical protein